MDQVRILAAAISSKRAVRRCAEFSLRYPGTDDNVVALTSGIRNQFDDGAVSLTHHPGRQERNHPATLRAESFHTIKEYLGPPALAIDLDSKLVDFGMHLAQKVILLPLQSLAAFLGCAYDIEGAPCEHAGHWAEIGSVDIAAEPCGLEGDLSGAAECVCYSRTVPVAHDAKLLHEPRERQRLSAQVDVDSVPYVVVDRVHDLLGTLCLFDTLPVRCLREDLRLEPSAVHLVEILAPSDLHRFVFGFRPVNRR